MTHQTAERVADVVLGLAAVALGVYVLRTPPLRRLAWQLLKVAVTTTLPAYLSQEVREAWASSGHAVARR